MTSKKRRRGECFFPESLEKEFESARETTEKINSAVESLRNIEEQSLVGVNLSEDEALLLLSSKISFVEVLNLKMALGHIPRVLNIQEKGSTVPLRILLVSEFLKATSSKWNCVAPSEVSKHVEFLETRCPLFCQQKMEINQESLWDLTKKNGQYAFNYFVTPPLSNCLKCGTALRMHRRPSKAIVHGLSGPLPATKVVLECKDCKIQYGCGKYGDSNGKSYYPKSLNQNLVEVSNVTYVEKDLYAWIPSLG